ncbi:hypothetical protein LXL04_027386 [Taraxacum kok-saghyz]
METFVEEGENKPKRQKLQEIVEEGEEDRISALPDCLLLEILDRLPSTKHAIKTGSLSKRWKHVWTSVPSLIFHQYMHRRPDFFSDIDKTLTQCRQSKVKRFEIDTVYDTQFESQVNRFICYAIRCEVEELNIMLWKAEVKSQLRLDQIFFNSSCFTRLKVGDCLLNPAGAITWKNLRSLCLSKGKLDEDLIENILSGSPQLETLVLNSYNGCRRLNITSKSVKNLVFSGRVGSEDEFVGNFIEINAPNILSLTIRCDLFIPMFLLANVSSLVNAELDYCNCDKRRRKAEKAEMLQEYILNLLHVKELKIGFNCSKALLYLEDKGFVFPVNLKFPNDWSDRSSSSGDSSDSDPSDSSSDSDSVDSVSDSSENDSVSDSSESDSDSDTSSSN